MQADVRIGTIMKLFLTSAYETHAGLTALKEFAMTDRVRRHELSYDPEDADAILFIENTQFDDILFKHLLNHPLVAKYPHFATSGWFRRCLNRMSSNLSLIHI